METTLPDKKKKTLIWLGFLPSPALAYLGFIFIFQSSLRLANASKKDTMVQEIIFITVGSIIFLLSFTVFISGFFIGYDHYLYQVPFSEYYLPIIYPCLGLFVRCCNFAQESQYYTESTKIGSIKDSRGNEVGGIYSEKTYHSPVCGWIVLIFFILSFVFLPLILLYYLFTLVPAILFGMGVGYLKIKF